MLGWSVCELSGFLGNRVRLNEPCWYHMHCVNHGVTLHYCIWLWNCVNMCCNYVIMYDWCEYYPLACIIHRYLLNVVLTPFFLVCCVCTSSGVQRIQVLELYVKCRLLDRVLGVALIRNTRLFWEFNFIGYDCWIFVTYQFYIQTVENHSLSGFYLLVASVSWSNFF